MSEYKVIEIAFRRRKSELQKVIDTEVKSGWKFVSISAFSTIVDDVDKSNAVIVFSKG